MLVMRWCLVLCVAGSAWATAEDAACGSLGLHVREDGVLLKDGAPYRGVGINYFSAFSRRLANAEDTSYREGFKELAGRGIPFVRFMACGFWPRGWQLYLEDKERYFALMDDVVKAAEETGIGLIPSLFWCVSTLPDLAGEPQSAWGNPESKTHAMMRQYVGDIVGRYAATPAIWAWEFGNEFSLQADLPNAADHRPPTSAHLGQPESRSEADDIRHDMVVSALREFAKTVRLHDPYRAITTGNSIPRPNAEHGRRELSWTRDTREEFKRNLDDINPDPNDLVSVHLYPHSAEKRFGESYTAYEELLGLCMDAARGAGKALFVGEFGAPDDEKNGGPSRARQENFAILTAIERCEVPLAALWNYDLPQQEQFINVTADNHRSYLLDALGRANRRLRLYASGTHAAELRNTTWSSRLLDNQANAGRQGSGFNPLWHAAFPGRNLFRGEFVGLNFEHIFNGVAGDRDRSLFTPRKDPCDLQVLGENTASLHWPAEGSSWGLECRMRYTLSGENALDLAFEVTPGAEHFGKGYVAMMWASYMSHTRGRQIHFYGTDAGREGWVAFGEDTGDSFETGTVSCHGVAALPYDAGAQTLNILEHPIKKFLLPFYYGLVDGDGKPETADDTMAYIMMFNQSEAIRFAMWNFIQDPAGHPDPRSPAWDWQFVIRAPVVGRTYGYKARLVYKPFVSEEDVREEYERWATP